MASGQSISPRSCTKLSYDHTGHSEHVVRCAFSTPARISATANGLLLSQGAAFLFIAAFGSGSPRHLFAETARLAAHGQGQSPFWNAWATHFFDNPVRRCRPD
ncbi:arginine N-succinyltransferase [Klebsiella pneumoniae]|nr:arginine N-succinyltransferase [Klebsiella pneumoniae]